MSAISHRKWKYAPATAAVACIVALQIALGNSRPWPENWNANLADPIDDLQVWIQDHRLTHWLFTGLFNPVSDFIESSIAQVAEWIAWLPWYTLALLAFLSIARTKRFVSATVCALITLYPAAVGLSEATTETLALIVVAILIAIAIGLPLGMLTALNPSAERIGRPILDAMQVIPATVYLIPSVIVFSIGVTPALVATVIYAIPPMVRLTALGIQSVPSATVEAAESFGASKQQSMYRVRLPLAAPSIVAGINQTIMMALGISVIAALVGAGGLGQEVQESLRLRSPGRGSIAGFAIVAIALVLDRVSKAFTEPRRTNRKIPIAQRIATVAALIAVIIIGRIAQWIEIPVHLNTSAVDSIDDFVIWIRDNLSEPLKTMSDFFVRELLIRGHRLMNETLAWPVVIAVSALIGWWAKGWRTAIFVCAGLAATGATGLWEQSTDTLIQVIIASVITLAIALPVGVVVGRAQWLNQALGPVLDALQTLPSLIYAIPFVMILSLSPVPGILASVLYAIPPGIRLTALGIQQVPEETVEAATTFGASPRQVMFGVRVPLAMPSIILAVNQVIMMVLAMVIISGLIGGGALGFEAITALTRGETGLGAEVAVAIVAMAMILDRCTQGIAHKLTPGNDRQPS